MFRLPSQIKQKGMAALMITMTILAVVTIITMFSARIIVTDNKIYQNQQNNAIALNAAQAGVDYALGYLNAVTANQTAIINNTSPALARCASASNTTCLAGGTVQACTTNGPTTSLPNGATYTMKYSCVAANNTTTFLISSLGTSPDGISHRTITETVLRYFGGGAPVVIYGTAAAITLNRATLLQNTVTGSTQTIDTYTTSNGDISISGSGPAQTCAGVVTPGTCPGGLYTCTGFKSIPPAVSPPTSCQDINYSDSAIHVIQTAGSPAIAFQEAYLGRTITSFASTADFTVNCTANASYSVGTTLTAGGACTCTGTNCASTVLNGLNGKTVYFTMNTYSLTFNNLFGANAVGTTNSPTYLVSTNASAVNLQNANTITGGVYTDSPVSLVSAASNTGALFSSSSVNLAKNNAFTGSIYAQSITLSQNSSVTYDGVNGVLGGSSVPQFGIVSGSWRDF